MTLARMEVVVWMALTHISVSVYLDGLDSIVKMVSVSQPSILFKFSCNLAFGKTLILEYVLACLKQVS